jgi:hypothetical protein
VTSPLGPGMGGLPPRRLDQAYDPGSPALPTGAQPVFRGRLVVISGTSTDGSTGLFVYSGTPANGNLVASIASAAGTDQFGNAYNAGITSYDPGVTGNVVNLFAGIITLSNSGFPTQIGATIQFANASMSLISARQSVAVANEILMAGGVSASTVTRIQGSDGSPAFLKTCEPNNFGSSTAWHNLSGFAAGWSVGIQVRYRFTIDNMVEIEFVDLAHDGVTGNPDGSTILSAANGLPTGFKPVSGPLRFPVYCNQIRVIAAGPPTTSSGAALEIEQNGSIQCFGMAQACTRVDGGFRFPID